LTGEPTSERKALGFSPSGALLKATLVHAAVPVSATRDPTNGVSGAGIGGPPCRASGTQLDRALDVKGNGPFNKMSVSFTKAQAGARQRRLVDSFPAHLSSRTQVRNETRTNL
jgi:hypothetical protein